MTLHSNQDDGPGRWVLGIFALFLIVGVLPITVVGTAAVLTEDGTGAVAGAATPTVVDVDLSEFKVGGTFDVPTGPVVLRVTNSGSMAHDLSIDALGAHTPMLDPGATAELDLGVVEEGTYDVHCTVAGHEESGMAGTLNVGAAPAGGVTEVAAGGHAGHSGHGAMDTDWGAMDAAMEETMLTFPAETAGTGNPILEPAIAADGTKQFELTAAITEWEVEPGKVVEAWTYNGVVPGPQLRLDVGDQVQVTIHNELPMGTDIHWHGITVPNDQDGVAPYTQPMVASGESYTYEFTVVEPMIAMYHAHHSGHLAVPNGLFAAMIVGDLDLPRGETISGVTIPADLQVAQEIPMVLNDAGVIGLTLNGKSFPATEPVVAKEGEWILTHYYNEGLQIHPMHLHGFRQLVVAKDGVPLDHPYWADTVNVAPGERYSVLFQAEDAGTWVWHCHILNHVERDSGMFGMVTALVVEDAA